METAHIIRWNVVSAKLLSSHLSGHYRSKIVHGWCPPPVQLQSGGTFLAWTKLLQEMNLTKLLGGCCCTRLQASSSYHRQLRCRILSVTCSLWTQPSGREDSLFTSVNRELCWTRLSRLVKKKKTVKWWQSLPGWGKHCSTEQNAGYLITPLDTHVQTG